jgi:hypothetical protein
VTIEGGSNEVFMPWYVASCILTYVRIDGENSTVPVFENFFLVEADDRAAASARAEEIGKLEADAAAGTTICQQPAEVRFLGVRKIRPVYSLNRAPGDGPLSDGDEVSHSFYHVEGLEMAKRLAEGKAVDVTYIDDDKITET